MTRETIQVELQWSKLPQKLYFTIYPTTIFINWFTSGFKTADCADCFEKNLRLLRITGFSVQFVTPVPKPRRNKRPGWLTWCHGKFLRRFIFRTSFKACPERISLAVLGRLFLTFSYFGPKGGSNFDRHSCTPYFRGWGATDVPSAPTKKRWST